MLVYDPIKPTVLNRAHYVIIACYVDDGWLVVVVPFEVGGRGRMGRVKVPVAIVPFDMFP